jgi:hypothetical protein
MNLLQLVLSKRRITGIFNQSIMEDGMLEPIVLFASGTDSAGGKGSEKSGRQDIEEPQASDDKRGKNNDGRAQQEDITNKATDEKENASITEPDTNLTGDTGNLDIGQTDLGASGSGAEDL